MYWYVKKFVAIALFKLKPQDIPATSNTLIHAAIFGMITYILAGVSAAGFVQAMQQALLDFVLSGLFILGFLYVQGRLSRFIQAYSALIGSGAVVNFVASPILLSVNPDQAFSEFISLLLLLLFMWSLALCAFIFKATFELSHSRSILIAVIYVLSVISLTQWVFPSAAP